MSHTNETGMKLSLGNKLKTRKYLLPISIMALSLPIVIMSFMALISTDDTSAMDIAYKQQLTIAKQAQETACTLEKQIASKKLELHYSNKSKLVVHFINLGNIDKSRRLSLGWNAFVISSLDKKVIF